MANKDKTLRKDSQSQMNIEFKEKTFEKYFSSEIARLTNIMFSPDQCDEFVLGFDDAFLLPIPELMRIAPFMRRRRWSRMRGILVSELNHVGDWISRRLPPFRFNLFVQYKRPDYLKTRGAAQWSDWQQAYYRYRTTPHQQDILEKTEAQSQGRAATIYASPAFWSAADLWTNVEAETIIENSNVASAARLKGHSRYSYVSPGHKGKAHSDTVDIESRPFEELITEGLENDELPLNQHLKKTATLINEVVQDSDSSAILFERAKSAIGVDQFDEDTIANALGTIEAFSDAFDLSYCAIG